MASTSHASKGYGTRRQLWSTNPKHSRARFELGLSPRVVVDEITINDVEGSHVIVGVAMAMSSLGSALAIAMIWWVAAGRPP